MSEIEFVPCPEWEEKLADFHAHRLSSADQVALKAHLASCQACTAVLLEYQRMDKQIHQLLAVQSLPRFTPELLPDRQEAFQMQETWTNKDLVVSGESRAQGQQSLPEHEASSLSQDRDLTDEELVQQTRQGDHEAFALLYSRYAPLIQRQLISLVGDPNDAEELVMEVFFKVFRQLPTLREGVRFKAWLYSITIYAALDWKRMQRSVVHSALEAQETVEKEVPDVLETLLDQEALYRIAQALHELPSPLRQCLVLSTQGYSTRDIAQTLRLRNSTVTTYISQARRRLKKALQEP